jgi:hypothetical protein
MIIVWGRKQYVRVSHDQSPLRQIVTIDRPAPCLNPLCSRPHEHGCRKVYHIQLYCTVYFCIPLCSIGPPHEVVKCEACGKMWQLDPYLAIVERANLVHRPSSAAVVVQVEEEMELPAQTGRLAASTRGQQQQQQQQQHPRREVLTVMEKDERVPFAYSCVPVCEPGDDQHRQEQVLPVLAVEAPLPIGTLT